MESKTITEWAIEIHALAKTKGWHDSFVNPRDMTRISIFLMNLHAEISELWESARKGQLDAPCDKAMGEEQLTCLEEELADIVIRTLDTAQVLGIDIERAIRVKHTYNATRSFRHGNKLA